jgi:SAM-dependent methyltransferase
MNTVSTHGIEMAVESVAEAMGEPARSTILYENGRKHVREIRRILEGLPAQGSVLDVGGGLGVNLLAIRTLRPDARLILADRFVEYDAGNRMGSTDSAFPLLEAAGVMLHSIDFWPRLELGLENGTIDVATSLDVIEHLPGHPLQHLREIRRVLKPDGTLLLASPNAASLMKRLKQLAGQHPYMDFDTWTSDPYYQHYREYTTKEHIRLLERSGFDVQDVHRCDAVTRSRAVSRWHRRRHPPMSVTAVALWMLAAVEMLVPGLRHSVEVVARPATAVGTPPAGP